MYRYFKLQHLAPARFLTLLLAFSFVVATVMVGPAFVKETGLINSMPASVQEVVEAGEQEAAAGALCDRTGICGDVYYKGGSKNYLVTTCNYGDPWSSTRRAYPGQWSSCKDVDGFYIPYRCLARVDGVGGSFYGPRWQKVLDLSNVKVRLSCW